MSVIFEYKNMLLFNHNRQQNSYETNNGNIIVYQLKENLFCNFKRKQKTKPKQIAIKTEAETEVEDFLKICKLKCLFPPTEEVSKETYKSENIELMNKFHKIVNDFGHFHGENNLKQGKVITLNEFSYLIPPNCKFFCKKIEDIESYLKPNASNKYDFVVIDPPWENRYIKRVKLANKGYPMMTDDEITAIPLGESLRVEINCLSCRLIKVIL